MEERDEVLIVLRAVIVQKDRRTHLPASVHVPLQNAVHLAVRSPTAESRCADDEHRGLCEHGHSGFLLRVDLAVPPIGKKQVLEELQSEVVGMEQPEVYSIQSNISPYCKV